MKHLLIGGTGRVGTAVRDRLRALDCDFEWTSRKPYGGGILFDPERSIVDNLPDADRVYIVAAETSTIACEADPRGTWHVNVDMPIAVARRYAAHGFVIFVSSDAVEFCGHMGYGRQKAHVESALAMHPRVAIARPSRILPERAEEFARLLVNIDRPGLHRWT